MQSWLKIILVPAAVALAGGTASAAPGLAGAAPPAETQAGADVTLVHHNYWHSRRQWERRNWRRHHYAPYRYYYRPRCYWSSYWHRTVCR